MTVVPQLGAGWSPNVDTVLCGAQWLLQKLTMFTLHAATNIHTHAESTIWTSGHM